jgi:hypothetical protein
MTAKELKAKRKADAARMRASWAANGMADFYANSVGGVGQRVHDGGVSHTTNDPRFAGLGTVAILVAAEKAGTSTLEAAEAMLAARG